MPASWSVGGVLLLRVRVAMLATFRKATPRCNGSRWRSGGATYGSRSQPIQNIGI
jgi:hypothetical protein